MIGAAIAGFAGAFLAVVLCISVGPLRDLTQELAVSDDEAVLGGIGRTRGGCGPA